jgi:hypothetical protein
MDTPCTAILLVTERDRPCTSILLAAVMDTPFTAILLVMETAGCGKGYRNESTNVSISKLIIGTKAKRFDFVRKLLERKQNVSIYSKIV